MTTLDPEDFSTLVEQCENAAVVLDREQTRSADAAWEKKRAEVEAAYASVLAEVDRLNSWAGLMSVLDKHYPPDVIGGNSTDPGARHVVLVRKLDQLGIELAAAREENQRLHARVDELDGVEQELATERGHHKRYLEMHDGACARLSAELDRLLPVVEAAKACVEHIKAEWSDPTTNDWLAPSTHALVAAVDALGTDAADGAGTGEQDVAQVRHRIDDLLCTAQRHLGNATDPDTPDTHFRCHLTIGARSAQAAYGLIELAKVLSPADCVAVAAGMAELLVDGEVLVSWLNEEMNREPAASLAGSSTATATVCDGCQKPVTGRPCGRGFCCEECRSECVNSTAVRDAS